MPDVAVVGAGPFGLSIAAWLGERARVYGTPMLTWRTLMPADMLMRSAWEETSLSAPLHGALGDGSIDDWAAAVGEPRQEPIPLQAFLRYAEWFRQRFVPDEVHADVAHVEPHAGGYRVVSTAGDETDVRVVVVAVGVTPFPAAPPVFADVLGERVSFAVADRDLGRFRGRRVLVVGAGQAGLETAGLAARDGAGVEVLARSAVRWFADREPHHERGPIGARLYRLAYPAIGYGPPPLNRLVLWPDVFAALPWSVRRRLTERLLRPGGSPWVHELVEGNVTLTEGVTVTRVEERGGMLQLQLSDGSRREVDHVLLATGYRFVLERLPFLGPELRSRIALAHGWPVLDRWFHSTASGLFFVGYPAEARFGPLSRFVLGAPFTARRVHAALR